MATEGIPPRPSLHAGSQHPAFHPAPIVETLTALVIEPGSEYAEALRRVLAQADPRELVWEPAKHLDHAVERLAREPFSAVLLGLPQPGIPDLHTVPRLRAAAPATAVVVLHSAADAPALALLQAGAQDCLHPGQLTLETLLRAIRYAVQRNHALAELERRARASEEQEARLRRILVASSDGVVIVDGSGGIRFVNPAAERLFGRTARELLGQPFGFPLVVGETAEVDILRPSEPPAVVEMRVAEIEWNSGTAYLASLRDITARKRAEEARAELIREQAARAEAEAALREREAFLALAAHELKTPVTRLSLVVQTALRRLDQQPDAGPDRMRQVLQAVRHQSDALAHLVAQLIDSSQLDLGTFTLRRSTIDFCDVVRGVVAALQGVWPARRIALHAPADPLLVFADRERIRQVVRSVLDNALRFAGERGPIEVEVATAPAAEPGAEDSVVLAVRDHGAGIPTELRARVFERQALRSGRSPTAGIGLGLYVARQIVERHGGTIRAEFPADGGTRFVVTLPLARATPPQTGSQRRVEGKRATPDPSGTVSAHRAAGGWGGGRAAGHPPPPLTARRAWRAKPRLAARGYWGVGAGR